MKTLIALNGESRVDAAGARSDGVGLVRGEYLVRQVGRWVTDARCQAHIASYLDTLAARFAPRPVWYRTIDMETQEANLQRGVDHTVHERHGLLGMRGVRRALAFVDGFRSEAQVLAQLSHRHDNLHVVLPFVQAPEEVEEVSRLLRCCGFVNRIAMMAELPATLVGLEAFFATGISQVLVGMNDLSSLMLGAARGGPWHRLLPPALAGLLREARQTTAARGIALAMAGHLDATCIDFARQTGFDAVVLHLGDAIARCHLGRQEVRGALDCQRVTARVRARLAAADAAAAVPDADWDYLGHVCAGLAAEMAAAADRVDEAAALVPAATQLQGRAAARPPVAAWAHWQALWADYTALCRSWTAALDGCGDVARCYDSMEAFWEDAALQARGESPHTFWDTYEHGGRRQLEAAVAALYGSEAALLLNSGMSAVTTCLDMLGLAPGDAVVTGEQSYFETSDYLMHVLAARGVRVERLPLTDREATVRRLTALQPRAAIFESATNAPEPSTPVGMLSWAAAAPSCLFICDNTVQGSLTRLFGADSPWPPAFAGRLVAVESATKYLCHGAMAGIVYGDMRWVEMARLHARRTGQQLQGRALHALRSGELRAAPARMALHARNAAALAASLRRAPSHFTAVRELGGTARAVAEALVGEQGGGLVFLRLAAPHHAEATAYRRLLQGWRTRAAAAGLGVDIRAGFGWRRTSARVYEGQQLNQADAPTYLRISVGIEPPAVMAELGACLSAAARAL